MANDSDFLQELINRPPESLSIELKGWIDPTTPEGIEKIVTSAIAMRNHGGGYVLIGFHNKTGEPLNDTLPPNVRELFHQDTIQRTVSEYTSECFEIKIHFPVINGIEFPVIEIGSGVKTPIATKKPLINSSGKILFQGNRVFIRSLESNHTPSTTEATWKDWPHIVETCFDNREADIGRFIRRNLRTLPPELSDTITSLAPLITLRKSTETKHETAAGKPEDKEVVTSNEEKPHETNSLEYLQEGDLRFNTIVKEKNLVVPDHGSWEVSVIINGTVPSYSANQSFLNLIGSSNPHYTGWPVWLDSRSFTNKEFRPYVFSGAWEALICDLSPDERRSIDFWRLSPSGKFYLRRGLEDDFLNGTGAPEPMKQLDFGLVILRSAEAIAVALEFARVMGCPVETTKLEFTFRWMKMRGRELTSWASRDRYIPRGNIASQDDIFSKIIVPLDTPRSAIAEYVYPITKTVFEVFNGLEIDIEVIEKMTRSLIDRGR